MMDLKETFKDEESYNKWFKEEGMGYLVQAILFIILLYVYLWVSHKYGPERAYISLLIMIFLGIQNLTKAVKSWKNSKN